VAVTLPSLPFPPACLGVLAGKEKKQAVEE